MEMKCQKIACEEISSTLSLSLSYSFTLRAFLDDVWITLTYISFGEIRQGERKCKGIARSKSIVGLPCR